MGKFGEIFGRFPQQSPFPVGLLGLLTFIRTEGALRKSMTYDNHPSIHPHVALNELNRPWIDLSQPSMS